MEDAGRPVVFQYTEGAAAGDVVFLQGSGFGREPEVWLGDRKLRRLSHFEDLYVSALLPPGLLDGDDHRLVVRNGAAESLAVVVNRARPLHFDTPSVSPGGVFRIFGRNLQVGAFAVDVRVGGMSARLVRGDRYVLTVQAPAGLRPGETYDVTVDNGNGAGAATAPRTLRALPAGRDAFNLGVGWATVLDFDRNVYDVKSDGRLASKAIGDGSANDLPALQAAIDRASADGGGVVYLPAGTYRLAFTSGNGLLLRHRVVMKGAGRGSTILRYGYSGAGVTPQSSLYGLAWDAAASRSGIMDLSLENVSAPGTWLKNSKINARDGRRPTEIFVKNIRYDLGHSGMLWWEGVDTMTIQDSEFVKPMSQNPEQNPMWLDGLSNFVIRNNTIRYTSMGIALKNAHDGVFEENRMVRDGSSGIVQGTTHHLALDMTDDLAVMGNTFQVADDQLPRNNDGETILSESWGGNRTENIGQVTSATTTTLTDTANTFAPAPGSQRPLTPRGNHAVAIVWGKGTGQWRTITKVSGDSLTVDPPWQVVPDATSRYVTFLWGATNWLIRDNVLSRNDRGIMLYSATARDVAIVGNRLVDSGGIWLRTDQRTLEKRFTPQFNIQILGNRVSGQGKIQPAVIGLWSAQVNQERTFGTSAFGIEVRDNLVEPAAMPTGDTGRHGFVNGMGYEPRADWVDDGIPALLGTIFQRNTCTGCASAYNLNSFSHATVIWEPNQIGALLRDDRVRGAARAAAGTVVGP